MKRIIDGKIYNTATATRVACAESSCYRSDFGYWSRICTAPRAGAGSFMARAAQ